MSNLCDYKNCRKRAFYGLTRDYPLRCKKHKENMKLASKICKCGKTYPHFNEPNEFIPICCSSCKTETMINLEKGFFHLTNLIKPFSYVIRVLYND